MRISDWSSDVCSSDLPAARPGPRLCREADRGGRAHHLSRGGGQYPRLYQPVAGHSERTRRYSRGIDGIEGDRKSVVEGKSVSVRVDHGGRRIINKTQKKYTHNHNYILSTYYQQ